MTIPQNGTGKIITYVYQALSVIMIIGSFVFTAVSKPSEEKVKEMIKSDPAIVRLEESNKNILSKLDELSRKLDKISEQVDDIKYKKQNR